VDTAGNVYVTEFATNRIQKFDSSGSYLTQWGSFGSGNGQFDQPFDVAADTAGNIYVADTNNHRIQKFDNSGSFLLAWGNNGTGSGQFKFPNGVAVDTAGNVYVADTNNHRIQKFDSSGNFLLAWGSNGTGSGQLKFPGSLAVDAAGNVYVADTGNNRLQKFDSSGSYLAQWGSFGSGSGQFDSPSAVAVDPAGSIFVTDTNNNRIQKFTTDTFVLDDAVPDDGDLVTDTLTFSELTSGSYTFTETVTAGWTLDSVACDSGSWTTGGDSLTVNLAGGQAITCTFNNSSGASAVPDILMTGFTADGHTTLTVTYEISGTAVSPFALDFYTSTDALYDAGDTPLSSVAVNAPADLTVGLHVLTFTLGADINLVSDANESDNDYYLLAVADVTDTVTETDAGPHNEDNTAVFHGAYIYPGPTNVFVHGTDSADTVFAGSNTLSLNGTGYYYGTAIGMRIRVHAGDDVVNSNFNGPVALFGGPGSDLLSGGNKPDYIDGGEGDDTLRGNASPDILQGGPGNDLLMGDNGNDLLDGGADNDTAAFPGSTAVNANLATGLATGLGTDTLENIENLTGSNSRTGDVLIGDAGDNILDGGNGNDILDGGLGADTLLGGGGNDSLTAGGGCSGDGAVDTVNGGAGVDTAVGVLNDPDAVIDVENLNC
jgi:streptogramin lyase